MRVRAVLFDLFDTLLLIRDGEAFYTPSLKKLHEFLVNNGVNVEFENFKRVYFEVRDSLYAEASKNFEEPHFNIRVSRTLQRLRYNFDVFHPIVDGATIAFAEEFMRFVCLDDDAPYVLQKLHGKYKLGIVSNFAIPECVSKLLEKFELKKFFDTILISGAINKRKPCPIIFAKALEALNVSASETVFVGDTPSMDVAGPKALGIKAILIERKHSATDTSQSMVWKSKEEAYVKPDGIIKSLRELPSILEDC
ncbi:MAG: HAD family hydrolase [Candidatus Bathyarchaeota archaeon]|jgi:putative hydrolase of the HAD superfamily|nr:HAD family hydrolase [Candidatus Bathyarchaeota archaeon]